MLEDKLDPAHAAISALIREAQAQSPGLSARIHSAGTTEHTSQKIHK